VDRDIQDLGFLEHIGQFAGRRGFLEEPELAGGSELAQMGLQDHAGQGAGGAFVDLDEAIGSVEQRQLQAPLRLVRGVQLRGLDAVSHGSQDRQLAGKAAEGLAAGLVTRDGAGPAQDVITDDEVPESGLGHPPLPEVI